MQKWYDGTNKKQKWLMWGISIGLIPFGGIGLIPLSVLIYLKLGSGNG